MVVIATKMDVANPDKLVKLRKHAKKLKLDFYEISAVTGQGIPELKYALGRRVARLRTGQSDEEYVAPRKPVSRRKAKKKSERAKRPSKRAAFKKRQSR
jgi:GTP-binding protein